MNAGLSPPCAQPLFRCLSSWGVRLAGVLDSVSLHCDLRLVAGAPKPARPQDAMKNSFWLHPPSSQPLRYCVQVADEFACGEDAEEVADEDAQEAEETADEDAEDAEEPADMEEVDGAQPIDTRDQPGDAPAAREIGYIISLAKCPV